MLFSAETSLTANPVRGAAPSALAKQSQSLVAAKPAGQASSLLVL